MPAILMTGYPEEVLAAELGELHAGYGCKPVNIGALVATIRLELACARRP
jgi:hypothetical protein